MELTSAFNVSWDVVLQQALLIIVGLVLGVALPRPRWLRKGSLLGTSAGVFLRRTILSFHLFLVLKQIWALWYNCYHTEGSIRAVLKALWTALCTWQPVQWPQRADGRVQDVAAQGEEEGTADELPNWHVTTEDLAFFRSKVEAEDPSAAAKWDHMMDVTYEGTGYSAWRRGVAGGKTEYKSITITPNATAEEFMDFYLDDPTRPKWDGMISEYTIVEAGPAAQRCLVVRWKRSFPFSFISSRDYVIARRLFRVGDALYGITKGIAHPASPVDGKTVRCESFYSMWRCRTIPCPHGSDRPACETVLLHHEDMKIPERLARFAVRHGMKGFFQGMVPLVKEFVAKRRIRLGPTESDPLAYGLAPLARCASDSALSDDCGSEASYATDSAYGQEAAGEGRAGMHKSPSLRRLGYMAIASGLALAIARTGSSANLAAAAGGPAPAGSATTTTTSKAAGAGGKAHHHRKRHGAGHGHRGSGSGYGGSQRRGRAHEIANLATLLE